MKTQSADETSKVVRLVGELSSKSFMCMFEMKKVIVIGEKIYAWFGNWIFPS